MSPLAGQGRLMYGDPRLRSADAVRLNTRGQAELWKYGISGDLPILLLRLKDGSEVTEVSSWVHDEGGLGGISNRSPASSLIRVGTRRKRTLARGP